MSCTCMDLALQGERLCKAGDCRAGVQFFEAAVQAGTDDLKTLSTIYSQLGNAYFFLQDYAKALEYHKHDLNLARTCRDRVGEAKASGNLGNTLKMIGKFDEAIVCCGRHLEISRELGDRLDEARALYNLGNVWHTKGKHMGRTCNQDPGDFSPQVKECLQKAIQYYEQNLSLVKELGDKSAQGRACGNLGNTHYLLGNFSQAIGYHEQRLAFAKEFGDKAAEKRAYTNLGNAHIFLGEFEVAAEHYKRSLAIAKSMQDRALEAQACYSLGNTYTLLRDYPLAIEYHMRHLRIAQELRDRVGEGRACWSLGNAHSALGNHQIALEFASKHLEISKETGDETGQLTAQMTLTDLKSLLGILPDGADAKNTDVTDIALSRRPEQRARRFSMENMEIMKLTPDKKEKTKAENGAQSKHKVHKSASIATDMDHSAHLSQRQDRDKNGTAEDMDEDSFFELLTRFQSRRIDDQRCSFHVLEAASVSPEHTPADLASLVASPGTDELMDMVAGVQGSRMNDQRASFPGLNSGKVIGQLLNSSQEQEVPDDSFFEMLMRCQASRLEDQRSALPRELPAPTVPDEDFFSLIMKMQSSRLDEQRTHLPKKSTPTTPGKKKKKGT